MVLEMQMPAPEVKEGLEAAVTGQAAQVRQAIPHLHHHHKVTKAVQELRHQVLQIMEEVAVADPKFMAMMVVVVAEATVAQARLVLYQAHQHTMQVEVEVEVV
jgi:hypothetical protein